MEELCGGMSGMFGGIVQKASGGTSGGNVRTPDSHAGLQVSTCSGYDLINTRN